MPLQSVRALWKAPEVAGCSWKYFKALVRASGVSQRISYGFWIELHVADVFLPSEAIFQVIHDFFPHGLIRLQPYAIVIAAWNLCP
jgi:hypothetical protein